MRWAAVTALVVLLAAAGGVTAAPPRPDGRAHLLLVPDTAEATSALARSDARTVARYEAFTLVEAAGEDEERLRRAGAERRDGMRTVETAAGAIDPVTERAALGVKRAPDRGRALALVQFAGPPKDAWLERLRATGSRLVAYQAENAYVVHAGGEAVGRLAALQGTDPAVRAVTLVSPEDKLEDRSSPSGVFAVTTITGAAGEAAREEAGDAVRAPVIVGPLRTDYVPLSSAEAARLAADAGVVAVEAHTEPQLLDERSAQIVAGNLTAPALTQPAEPPAYRDWLLGKGFADSTFDFAIDVTDGGLDNGADPPAHPGFYEGGSATRADRLAYAVNYTTDADTRDCGGHGTNVASIAAGHGRPGGGTEFEDERGFDHGMGIAPFARVGVSKLFNCAGALAPGVSPSALVAAAYAGGARVSNNSWGSDGNSYTAISAAYDGLVRDASADPGSQPLVEVFAAGNYGDRGSGTLGNEATAKNVITVGAAEGVRASGTDGCGATNASADSARDIASFSSRGPTADGRLKPDLVAPGTHIAGAAPQHAGYNATSVCTKYLAGTTWYSLVSGTSQAAPQVAGAAALVRSWYQRTQGAPPSPALTKALLVNTATDLGGGQNGKGDTIAAGPNHDQGWGRVNVGNMLDGTRRAFRDQADTLNTSGDQRLRTYSVHDPAKPLKVTLAWTDAPGTNTGNPSVNDLDLVVDAGGHTYRGNVFAGGYSRTGGTADTRNNLEGVHLPAGTTGRIAVRVVGTTIAGDGVPGNVDVTDQDYALVVSNAEAAATAVLSHDATTLDTSIGAGGDGDGALEPGESFALGERLANRGDAAAASVSGTLSGPGLTFSQGTSGWSDLAPGALGTNGTRFAGTLASGVTCGAEVTATLSLTTAGGGSHTVPLTLPTGLADDPVTRTASPQLAIPDDDAAGVSSTIDVAALGRIKDVDVRIAEIDHPWVGDLRIDVVAPDGTVVTLAQHPGGLGNGGDDFVDTVFDDEAPVGLGARLAPYTGRVRPQNDQLSRFDGKPQQGTWTLRVRDLSEGDTGSFGGWGTDTSTATCSLETVTRIDSGPAEAGTAGARDAAFAFSSDVPGVGFECRLDGGAFAPCGSPKAYAGLADGPHAFEVRAVDGGSADPTPERRAWTIDATAPEPVVLEAGATGIAGTAGAAARDSETVSLTVSEGGSPVRTLSTPRDAAGAWSADLTPPLPPGRYTVRAEQSDDVVPPNVGRSPELAFEIAAPPPPVVVPPSDVVPPASPPPVVVPPPPPSFLVAPAEARPNDVRVLAACASACTVKARLAGVGSGSAALPGAGTAVVRVKAKGRAPRRATLQVTLSEGGATLRLRRTVALRAPRIAGRGLPLWTACAGGCELSASLTAAGRAVAAGRATAPGRLTLRVPSAAKAAARKARSLQLAAAVGTRTATMTLRAARAGARR